MFTGSESKDFLDKEGEAIDYESKDAELLKDEMVIQTMEKKIMTQVNENHPNVIDIMVEGQIDLELFAAPQEIVCLAMPRKLSVWKLSGRSREIFPTGVQI